MFRPVFVEYYASSNNIFGTVLVLSKLVERSLPILEARGSNPVIGKNYTFNICSLSTVLKRRTQRKQAGNGPFKTITIFMGIRNNELQFQTHFYAIVITLCCTKTNLNGKQIKLLQSYFTNYFFYSISHTLTSFFIFHTHHT